MSFEHWADRTFGSSFIEEETITYFRMSAAYEAGAEEVKQQRDELIAALKDLREAEWMMCCDYGDTAVRTSILNKVDAAIKKAES